MKFTAFNSEWMEISFHKEKIILDRTQLYFLENYLKSKVTGIRIINGFLLMDGRLIFEVAIGKNEKSFHHGLEEVIDYLIVFNQKLLPSSLTKAMIRIKRWNHAPASMNKPSVLFPSPYL